MKIPVFVSCPTALSNDQEASRKMILKELDRYSCEPRALGRSDYPTDCPLREVLMLARHCAGGIILGYEQFQAQSGIWKRNTSNASPLTKPIPFSTPWNQLEAGILFSIGMPILVFAEEGVIGGIFDKGVTDVFIHQMPNPMISQSAKKGLSAVFQKWQSNVRNFYYR